MFSALPQRTRSVLDPALVAFTALMAAHPLDEADSFFHLSLGRAVLQARSRVVPEPTAFLAFDRPAVASEWLWSVLCYAAHSGGGFQALSWLGIALAALAAACVLRCVRVFAADSADTALTSLIAVAVICVMQCRIATRPELALLIALPCFLWGARSYASATGRRRLRIGLTLAAGSVVWAQLHGSFVLTPVLFVLLVARPGSRSQLRCDGLTLILLLASLLTSAYGPLVGGFIAAHAAGDATRYIAEMARPTWAMLNPLSSANVFGYTLMWLLGAGGALLAQRIFARELLLALLGAALFATANRFIAEAAILAIPLAVRGGGGLSAHWHHASRDQEGSFRLSSALTTGLLLAASAQQMQSLHGPIGELGVAPHVFPLHATAALTPLPDGAAVLTDYEASAPLGFVSGGRLRSFVDGRTPLYFDDTDFAVEREMLHDPSALWNGNARYDVAAAVVRRDGDSCVELARHWSVALVEPLFTTFVKVPHDHTLHTLAPCGVRYVRPESCDDPALAAELTRERGLGAAEFTRFLQVERALYCGGDAGDALTSLQALEGHSRPYARAFQRALVEALLRAGDFTSATQHMLAALDAGDAGMINNLQSAAAGQLPLADVRKVLERHCAIAADQSDLGVRVTLAEICARQGDEECARFHATRAAVRGRKSRALEWLASSHSDARVRRDAQRWREVLDRAPLTAAAAP